MGCYKYMCSSYINDIICLQYTTTYLQADYSLIQINKNALQLTFVYSHVHIVS